MTLGKDLILSPQINLGNDLKIPLGTYFTTADPYARVGPYNYTCNLSNHIKHKPVQSAQLNRSFSSHDLN